jgi:hypothetical protein
MYKVFTMCSLYSVGVSGIAQKIASSKASSCLFITMRAETMHGTTFPLRVTMGRSNRQVCGPPKNAEQHLSANMCLYASGTLHIKREAKQPTLVRRGAEKTHVNTYLPVIRK